MEKGTVFGKALSVTLAAAMLLTGVACSSDSGGGATGEPSSNPSPGTAAESTKPKEPVTLVLKHSTYATFDKDLEPAIKKYQETNPHVTVKVEHVVPKQGENIITANTALFAAGEQVDILRVSPNVGIGEYAARGWVVPLDDYIKKSGLDVSKYYPSLQTRGVYANARYALPWIHSQFMVFYNKDLFQKFGISEPKLNWTYEDMQNIGKKVLENKIFPVDNSFSNMLHIVGGAFGGRTFNEAGNQLALDNPAALKGFEFFRDMRNKEGIVKGPVTDEKEMAGNGEFLKGTAAMSFTWLKMKQFDEAKLNYGIVPAPGAPGGKQQGYGALDGIALSSTSKNKEEAFKLIKFLAYDHDGQMELIKSKLTIPVFPGEQSQIIAWETAVGRKDVTDAIMYQVEKTNAEGVGMMNNLPGTEMAFEGFVSFLGKNLSNDSFDLYTEIPKKMKELNAQWLDLQKEAEKQLKK